MRVAFNATALLSPLTGIGQYSQELARRLAADPALEPDFFYGLGWSRQVREAPVPGAATLLPAARRYLPNPYALRRWIQQTRFRGHARRGRFDVYHEPNFLPLPFDGPTVVTVHDLSWIRYPQAHPAERVAAMNRYFEPGLRRASLVLTDSEFVRGEVIEVFGVDPARILAIPLGVSPQFRPMATDATAPALHAHGLRHGSYLLAVGTLEPRKNLVAALRAYAGLPAALQERYPLVLAGLRGWNNEELEREIAPLVASGRVRLTGYLSRSDLAALIAGATALVYPSVYEGFGLPPLEAMACGVPVIVSNAASLPEVVGDTGLLVDPHDHTALRSRMEQMISDTALRARLGALALERARGFTWEACAASTVAAYRRAAAG